MDKKREIELKPCPYCGGTDLQIDWNGVWERHFVRCYNHACNMQGSEVYGSEAAAEAWNNLPRKVEALFPGRSRKGARMPRAAGKYKTKKVMP